MNLEQQVTSLALSQRLRELGVRQESAFGWVEVLENEAKTTTLHIYYKKDEHPEDYAFVTGDEVRDFFAAFTVAELGEMLWNAFEKNGWHLLYMAYGEVFDFKDTQRIGDLGILNLMRRPDMAAKMLIYLLENKLITV